MKKLILCTLLLPFFGYGATITEPDPDAHNGREMWALLYVNDQNLKTETEANTAILANLAALESQLSVDFIIASELASEANLETFIGVAMLSEAEATATYQPLSSLEDDVEAVVDLQDLQGAVVDGQIPSEIARDSEVAVLNYDILAAVNITSNTTQLSPSGIKSGSMVYLTSDGDYDIYSLVALSGEGWVDVHNGNAAAGGVLRLVEEHTSGTTAANRFKGGDISLAPGATCRLLYSPTVDTRWLTGGLPVNADHLQIDTGTGELELTQAMETTIYTITAVGATVDVATGDVLGDVFFVVPSEINGWDLVAVEASHYAVGTGAGSDTTDFQIHNLTQAADMLSTKVTVDEDEINSSTAAAAAVIDTSNDDVATGDILRIDCDDVVTGTAPTGASFNLHFRKP